MMGLLSGNQGELVLEHAPELANRERASALRAVDLEKPAIPPVIT